MMGRRWIAPFTLLLAFCSLAACGVAPPTAPATAPTVARATTAPAAPAATGTATIAPPPAAPTADPTADLDWVLQAGPAETAYRVPLLTRHVDSNRVWLHYELAEPTQAELVLWPVDRSAEPRRIELERRSDMLAVDGLRAGVRYAASIVIGGPERASRPTLAGEVWPPVEFTTQDGEGPLMVGVIGDSGFGDAVTAALVERMMDYELDFTLHTGDLVYRVHENPDPATAFVEKLYQPLAPLLQRGPFYPVPGNHEYDAAARADGEPYYAHAFPPLSEAGREEGEGSWYAFAYDDIQFVMLDSQTLFGVPGLAEQEAWLDERLADVSNRYTVVVLHVPPYSVGRHQTDARVVNSRWLERLRAPGVRLVIAGHDHNYQRFLIDGAMYLVSGGGSAVTYPLQAADPRLRAASSRPHFVLLRFEADRIVVEAIDEQGISLDWAEFRSTDPGS